MDKEGLKKQELLRNLQILKALMAQPYRSMYSLKDDLADLGTKINRAYIQRHIPTMERDGYVRTEKGKRNATKIAITWKGCAFLVINHDNLSDKELKMLFSWLYNQRGYRLPETSSGLRMFMIDLAVSEIRSIFDSLRKVTNLDFFDEAAFQALMFGRIIDVIYQQYLRLKRKPLATSRRLKRIAKRDLKRIPKVDGDALKALETYLEAWKVERKRTDNRIAFLEDFLSSFGKKGRNNP